MCCLVAHYVEGSPILAVTGRDDLVNATRVAEWLGVARRALGRKVSQLEGSGNAVRVGNGLLFKSQGLEAGYAAVTEVQISNAKQAETMALQEVEADTAAGAIPPPVG